MGNVFCSEKVDSSAPGSETCSVETPHVSDSETVVAVQPGQVDPYIKFVIYVLAQILVSCLYFPEDCGKQQTQRMTHACFMCGLGSGIYDVGNSKQVPCCTCCADYWTCYTCHEYVSGGTDSSREAPDEVCYSDICKYLGMYCDLLPAEKQKPGIYNESLCCCDCLVDIIKYIIMTAGCAPIFLPIATVNCGCNIIYFILCRQAPTPAINICC